MVELFTMLDLQLGAYNSTIRAANIARMIEDMENKNTPSEGDKMIEPGFLVDIELCSMG
jgi:hypothetical protein